MKISRFQRGSVVQYKKKAVMSMKKFAKVILAFLSVIIFYAAAMGVRFAANALNTSLEGTVGLIVLLAFTAIYSLLVFYGYTLTVFALHEKKYLNALLFTAAAAVGGLASNAVLNGFYSFEFSVLPILLFVCASFLFPFALTLITKNRAVLFALSCMALVFLNIILLNTLSPDSVSALGVAFPNLRIDSELGDNNGVLSYLLYVILFAVEYFIMKKCYKKIRG